MNEKTARDNEALIDFWSGAFAMSEEEMAEGLQATLIAVGEGLQPLHTHRSRLRIGLPRGDGDRQLF